MIQVRHKLRQNASETLSLPKHIFKSYFSDSCKKCEGKVYEMERITSKSGVWHRQCFTCNGCKCSMTNTLDDVFDREGIIYCRPCLKKHFEEVANLKPMTYSDTKRIAAVKDEDKCPQCSGAVFEAEKVTFNGRVFHQSCFVCSTCTAKLDSLNAQSISGSWLMFTLHERILKLFQFTFLKRSKCGNLILFN